MKIRTTFATGLQAFRFRCVHCDHAQECIILTHGVGSETAFNESGSGARGAAAASVQQGIDTLAFVPCPQCGKTDEDRGGQIRRKARLTFWLLPPITSFGVLGGLMFLKFDDTFSKPTPLLLLSGICVMLWVTLFFTVKAPWSKIDERCRFVVPGP